MAEPSILDNTWSTDLPNHVDVPASGWGPFWRKPRPVRPTYGAQPVISVIVGSVQRTFSVHKTVLIRNSSFFEKALSGNFKEAKEGVVNLAEDDPDVFELYVDWLYSETLHAADIPWGLLVRLYVFADIRGSPALTYLVLNGIYDEYSEESRKGCRYDLMNEIPWVYENTTTRSLLRRILVKLVAHEFFPSDQLCFRSERFVPEFLLDLAVSMIPMANTRMRAPWLNGTGGVNYFYFHDYLDDNN